MSRPRLVMCVLTFGGGGAENQVRRLAEGLRDRFAITVLTGKPQEDLSPPEGVEVRSVVSDETFVSKLLRFQRVVQVCRLLAPDLIYSRYVYFNLALARARKGRRLNCPLVIQEMISPTHHFPGNAWDARLMRRYYPSADLVLGNSTAVVEELVRDFGISRSRCKYLPNAAPSPRRRAARSESGIAVLAVGRLEAQKGFADLIRAFAEVREAIPATLTVVGQGSQRRELEEFAAHMGVADQVVFAGQVADPAVFYEAADIFVLSSLYEGMSNALMEAMAHGLPVVATDVSGTRDLIQDGRDGVVVPPSDPRALAAAVSELAADSSRRQSLGQAARRRIRDFDATSVCGRYADTFLELAPAAGRRDHGRN